MACLEESRRFRSHGHGILRAVFFRSVLLCLLLALVAASSGCTAFTLGGKLVKELRSENDRLLAEFRAERDRRQQLEKKIRVMEDRLAESEKLLARQYSSTDERLSQLSSGLGGRNVSQPPYRSEEGGFPDSVRQNTDSYGGTNADSGLRWQRRTDR